METPKPKFKHGFKYQILSNGDVKTITGNQYAWYGFEYFCDYDMSRCICEQTLVERLADGRFVEITT